MRPCGKYTEQQRTCIMHTECFPGIAVAVNQGVKYVALSQAKGSSMVGLSDAAF
jgi:hypothetical protein